MDHGYNNENENEALPQGVAQRVLDGMAAIAAVGGGIEGHRYAGAKTLEMNLSAEARRVHEELVAALISGEATANELYRWGLLCNRLGLDLNEPEDSDE